jgi:hypothetical protein
VARLLAYSLAWAFVIAVTGVDIAWAVTYHDSAAEWESNPVMGWLIAAHGVEAAAALRAATVLLVAALMPLATRRCRIAATILVTGIHVYLAVAYVLILWGAELGLAEV